MQLIHSPSPNFDNRPAGRVIDMLVLHYTGMQTGGEALERLCDKASNVSAHYLVEEDGRIFQMVAEEKRAWHAGISYWQGEEGLNACSIGMEIVNPGHEWGYRAFPELQMDAVIKLASAIVKRYNISADRVVGHSDIAPDRKQDPGELFDWHLLAQNGIGAWADSDEKTQLRDLSVGQRSDEISLLQQQLVEIGFGLSVTGIYESDTLNAVTAFQRHWLPEHVTGVACENTQAVLSALIRNI